MKCEDAFADGEGGDDMVVVLACILKTKNIKHRK